MGLGGIESLVGSDDSVVFEERDIVYRPQGLKHE